MCGDDGQAMTRQTNTNMATIRLTIVVGLIALQIDKYISKSLRQKDFNFCFFWG